MNGKTFQTTKKLEVGAKEIKIDKVFVVNHVLSRNNRIILVLLSINQIFIDLFQVDVDRDEFSSSFC